MKLIGIIIFTFILCISKSSVFAKTCEDLYLVDYTTPPGTSVYDADFSPVGDAIAYGTSLGLVKVVNTENGEEKIIKHSDIVTSVQFSPDGKRLASASTDGFVKITNLKTGKESVIDNQKIGVKRLHFSQDNKKLMIILANWELILLDVGTGKKETFARDAYDLQLDGVMLTTLDKNKTVILKMRSLSRDEGAASTIIRSPKNDLLTIDHEVLSIRKNLKCLSFQDIKIKDDCSNCGIDEKKSTTKTSAQLLCHLPSNASTKKEWIKILPIPSASMTKDDAFAYLMAYQKPVNFDPERDTPILSAILDSDLVKRESALVTGALHSVMLTSFPLYQKLFEKFPSLKNLKIEKSPCLLEEEERGFYKKTFEYSRWLKSRLPSKTELEDWESLRPIAISFKNISSPKDQGEKDDLIDYIAQSMADHAADQSGWNKVFLSKLYKFTTQAVNRLLGEPVKPLTDITYLRYSDRVIPLILGVERIQVNDVTDGDLKTVTPYGFYYYDFREIPLHEKKSVLADRKISWSMDKKSYSTNLKITAIGTRYGLVRSEDAPRYAELWKDKNLYGLIVTGSNLKNIGSDVIGSYFSYYQSQGFIFDNQPRGIKDLESYMGEKVKSGELDYLVKEAHSDGDEKNIFRADLKAEFKRGVKTYPDGRKETIDLVYPSATDIRTKLISNEEFGSWIKERDERAGGMGTQFVFFNTSCWSKNKAIHEIEAAASPTLLDIASTTSVETFANDPKSAEYQLFDSFRHGKNYQEMRAAMEENEDYRNKRDNVFIFPDQYEYEKEITAVIEKPIKIESQIFDENGNSLNIDEIH